MNNRDAFSHSEQCDQFFSSPAVTHPGTGYLVSGFEQAHDKCRCWCHNAQHLFLSPEPEYDFTPPPEYLSSADRAFMLDEPAHVRVGFSRELVSEIPAELESISVLSANSDLLRYQGQVLPLATIAGLDIHEGPANKAGFSKWSRKELASGECETCGDKLVDCECVE